MKIQKAISLYTLTTFERNNKSSFFQKPYESRLYFEEKAALKQHHQFQASCSSPDYEPIPALKETDSSGAERVVLLNKCELPFTNLLYTQELQKVITENRDSVIAVSLTKVITYLQIENTNDYQPCITYNVTCADSVDANTQFLYTQATAGSYFVERGNEVNITPYIPVYNAEI